MCLLARAENQHKCLEAWISKGHKDRQKIMKRNRWMKDNYRRDKKVTYVWFCYIYKIIIQSHSVCTNPLSLSLTAVFVNDQQITYTGRDLNDRIKRHWEGCGRIQPIFINFALCVSAYYHHTLTFFVVVVAEILVPKATAVVTLTLHHCLHGCRMDWKPCLLFFFSFW